MTRDGDNFVFQRVTSGMGKPSVRLRLASGRQVELLSFHIEPAYEFTGDAPQPVLEKVVMRLYPNDRPVIVTPWRVATKPAFVCVAYLHSDTPTGATVGANYSYVVVCGLVENIDKGVRGLVCELLSRVHWESQAFDDTMW